MNIYDLLEDAETFWKGQFYCGGKFCHWITWNLLLRWKTREPSAASNILPSYLLL